MLLGFHLGIDLVDCATLINKVGHPADPLVFPAQEFLGTPHTVGGEHVVALIAQHGEGEIVLLYKFLLLLRRISADTDDLNAPLRVLLEFITESLALGDSAGGTGFGEEPQDQLTALEVAQGHRLFIGIGEGKIGGLSAGFK